MRNLSGELVLLGTGTSTGVPLLGCHCPTCESSDPRDKRTRTGVVLGLPQGTLLIDTPTDLRFQLLRERIDVVHAVLYTHEHADHIFGLDDLRIMPFAIGGPVPLYCEAHVEERIRKSFDYAFLPSRSPHSGAIPQLTFQRIGLEPFDLLGQHIIPLRLHHGSFEVLGFRFGNVAYCTDTNRIPDETWPLLEGLDVLVLDALRTQPHPTHFSLDEAIAAARRIGARQTYFTHMTHDLPHEATNARLPAGMQLAYDGLRIPLGK
jgi:phosphoribosyl 1,2-cyclic phosphate phosphodiesterase